MNARTCGIVVLAVMLAGLRAAPALAMAESGFGLFGGLASHSGSVTAKPPFVGTASYTSSGISIGIDYQIALGDNLSLNPFLMSSSETTSGDLIDGTAAGHGIIGVELRLWIGDLFLGGHVGNYSEALTNSNDTVGGRGPGSGLSLGWAAPGGLFVFGQVDSATIEYDDATTDLSSFRLQAGYRWK